MNTFKCIPQGQYYPSTKIEEENFTYCKGCAHGKVPEIALTEDLNKDGISDLVYWMFGHNSKFDF